jgi:stage III sporulation protein AB
MIFIKVLGAAAIVLGCAAFGLSSAYKERREASQLRALIYLLDNFKLALMHNSPSIANVCRKIATDKSNQVHELFLELANVLDRHVSPNVSGCMDKIVDKFPELTESIRTALHLIGDSLGAYGLELQLSGLASVRATLSQTLKNLREGQRERHRCMQTLWLCAGAGLAILFV